LAFYFVLEGGIFGIVFDGFLITSLRMLFLVSFPGKIARRMLVTINVTASIAVILLRTVGVSAPNTVSIPPPPKIFESEEPFPDWRRTIPISKIQIITWNASKRPYILFSLIIYNSQK